MSRVTKMVQYWRCKCHNRDLTCSMGSLWSYSQHECTNLMSNICTPWWKCVASYQGMGRKNKSFDWCNSTPIDRPIFYRRGTEDDLLVGLLWLLSTHHGVDFLKKELVPPSAHFTHCDLWQVASREPHEESPRDLNVRIKSNLHNFDTTMSNRMKSY